MSLPLFKSTLKSNWILVVIFCLIFLMYIASFLAMYNPNSQEEMETLFEMFPKELIKAMGIDYLPADLTGYLGSYMYGMLVFLIPLIYISILGNRLIAKHVDNGSMAYLLTTPNTRNKIAFTQAVYFLLSIFVIFVFITGTTILMSQSMFPDKLDIPVFIKLNVCAFLLTCAISSVSWFFSCLFNDSKYSLMLGVGVPVAFFVFNAISNINEKIEWLDYLSLYSLFDALDIITGETNSLGLSLIFGGIAIILYTSGIIVFKKKNIPL